MPRIIDAPDPASMTDPLKVYAVTENAFNTLMEQAIKLGLPIKPPLGFVYLPTVALIRNFQTACQDILAALKKT